MPFAFQKGDNSIVNYFFIFSMLAHKEEGKKALFNGSAPNGVNAPQPSLALSAHTPKEDLKV